MGWSCDTDPPAFYYWTEPVARKPHRCCECRGPIHVGERHFAYRGKWDGGISTGRQHLLCMEACMLVRDELEGECIVFGGLFEWFHDMSGEDWYQSRKADAWKRLRSMLARIKWRRRKDRAALAADPATPEEPR